MVLEPTLLTPTNSHLSTSAGSDVAEAFRGGVGAGFIKVVGLNNKDKTPKTTDLRLLYKGIPIFRVCLYLI